jgi:hypothetical protein
MRWYSFFILILQVGPGIFSSLSPLSLFHRFDQRLQQKNVKYTVMLRLKGAFVEAFIMKRV